MSKKSGASHSIESRDRIGKIPIAVVSRLTCGSGPSRLRGMKACLLLVLLSWFVVPSLRAEDSTEPKQPTKAEAKVAFEKADKALNEIWAKAKTDLPASQFEALKIDQRGWIEWRDYIAASFANVGSEVPEDKAKDTSEYLALAADLMETRVQWLKGYLKDPVEGDTRTGVWKDSQGGELNLVQEGKKLFFTIDVVRGPTYHLGSIGGEAFWNSPLGWFSDQGNDPEKKDEPTNLAFIQRDKELEVVGANTSPYHGARAYFDGKYIRVAALSKEQAAKVKKEAVEGPADQ